MKHKKKINKNRKFRASLRLHFSLAAIMTLCFSCLFSCALVIVPVRLFYRGPLTGDTVILLCLLVCALSMTLGGIALWFGTVHITRPIDVVSQAVKKVAEGDFTIRIPRNKERRGGYSYTNELDELSENFNKMVSELDGMDYMRKDFMSNVSHEVKTPVAAITGFTEILLDGGLDEEDQQDYLKLVNQESIRLSVLCENMLRMSRLDYQQIVTKTDEVRIDEQIRKCIIMLSEKWADHETRYDLQLTPATIASDADLLMQVWMNLIDNAIKYSPAGSTLRMKETCENNELVVLIQDEGIGISPEKREKIFDKFYQCEESHKKQGNGLGLSIVKRILELLDGSITCESTPSVGTTMSVRMPIHQVLSENAGNPSGSSNHHPR